MISFDDFVGLLSLQLLPLNEQKSRMLFFELISEDGEKLKYEDLKSFCFDLSLNYTETQYKEFFESFSFSSKDYISWEEFDRLLEYCLEDQ